MADKIGKESGEPGEAGAIENIYAACDNEMTSCGGCGSKRKRIDTWWYIIAVLVILLIAVLVVRYRSGTT